MTEGTSVAKKLLAIQEQLHAPKAEEGRFGKHRNVEGILEALKPHLKTNKAALVLTNDITEVNGRNYVSATATLIDSEGGDTISATAHAWEGELSRGLDAPQVTGSASSYARKYALSGLFAIDDTKDPDSHRDDPEPPTPAKPKAPVAPKKPELKDTDPATPQQKQQLKNMMTALGMEPDAMSMLVESVLEKPTVDTVGDFKKVVEAMEETA